MHYDADFGMECRIGRFHNIYGPCGTWKGGREKAPAAFCRKAITSTTEFEMWGNGKQTRSFCYIDDCVEGILRLMVSDYKKPLNIGSDEMVSMNEMAAIVLGFKGKDLPIKHIPGPEGVPRPQLRQHAHQAGARLGAADVAQGGPRVHVQVDQRAGGPTSRRATRWSRSRSPRSSRRR